MRECRAIFIRTHAQGQVLVNGTIIYTEGDTVTAWAEKWKQEYLAEGWELEPGGDPELQSSGSGIQ